jgi:catechol 2,3-dioxygenase-like lactoylglutathione lyase family enzyme
MTQDMQALLEECATRYPEGGVFGTLTSSVIECVDLDRVERFYTETLGMPVTLKGEGWTVLGGVPGEVVLWQGDKTELAPCFMGADVPAAIREARRRDLDPTDICAHPGGTHFYINDPDGTLIQIGDR